MPFELTNKKSGDVLQSQEWNAIIAEIKRLETAKINREGADTLKGSLSISEALTVNGNVTIGRIQQTTKLEIFGTLKLQQGIAINEFSNDVNLSDNSDLAVPTEKAIKTYTDTRINQLNQTLTTKAALAGSANQDFQTKDLRVNGDWYWTPSKDFKLTPTAANQEWSFDLMNQANTTGCSWQVWSDRPNLGSLLLVRGDTGNVGIGTGDPQRRLQIAGDVNGLSFEAGTGTPNSGVIRFGDNTGWKLHFGRSRDASNGNLNSGTAGVLMTIQDNGNVGIGTTNPTAKLSVVGAAMINNGSNYAVVNNFMASGSLTIGSTNANYGGGSGWTSNTAGLLLETQSNTEIAVHDSGNRLASLMYYEGDNANRITIGRNMGWGSLNTLVLNSNNITITGTLTVNSAIRAASSDIYFTDTEHNHTAFGNTTGYAAIENAKNYDALMILGRAGTDKGRCVKLWDYLEVNGNLSIVNNSNQFTMRLSSTALFFDLSKAYHGNNRTIAWDGDGNWDLQSDICLKTDIDNEGSILNRLMQLDVKNYRWKDNPHAKVKKIGFIAQDVLPLFPSLVGEMKSSEEDEPILTLKYGDFGVLAIGGLKELKTEMDNQINQLKTEFDTQVNQLKNQIQQLSGK